MNRVWWRDPVVPSLVLFGGIVVAGFVTVGFAWRVTARMLDVGRQLPAIVSGLFIGVALVVIGAGFVSVQVSRRLAAGEHAQLDALIQQVAAVVDADESR